METIFVLLPLALLIAAIAVGFFVWAARTGQFDDLETPAVRILFDDDEPRRPGVNREFPVSGSPATGTTMKPALPARSAAKSPEPKARSRSSRRVPE